MNILQIQGKDRLEEFGIKPSLHRIAVMDFLMTHPVHPTADVIFNELYPSIPTLSKTTVYNTLKLLEEQGAIQAIHIDDKGIRYDADISLHAHFKCKKCGKIHDLYIEDSDLPKTKISDTLLVKECQVYYKGYCESCKADIN